MKPTERTDLRHTLRDPDSYPGLSKAEVYEMKEEVVA